MLVPGFTRAIDAHPGRRGTKLKLDHARRETSRSERRVSVRGRGLFKVTLFKESMLLHRVERIMALLMTLLANDGVRDAFFFSKSRQPPPPLDRSSSHRRRRPAAISARHSRQFQHRGSTLLHLNDHSCFSFCFIFLFLSVPAIQKHLRLRRMAIAEPLRIPIFL